jgi:hypothetical protein
MGRHLMPLHWVLCLAPVLTAQVSPQAPGITIRVVEGNGAINSIKMHRAHDPVVEVVDAQGRPAADATVTFLLPGTGPSGEFLGGGLSLTLQTGANGRAAAQGLHPNRVEGQFRIRVTASWRGQAANATLMQTNAEPAAQSKSSKKIIILALIGAAAVGGAVAATHGGSGGNSGGGSTGGTPTGATISAGTPTLGPPH